MKNRITTTLAIAITALGLSGLPALASADSGKHGGDLFKSQRGHSERGGDRHHDRSHQNRHHGKHGGYSQRYHERHYHGQYRHGHHKHKHGHGHRHGFGPEYGYYRQPQGHYHGHGSHISLGGFYVAPPLGIGIVIH